MARRFTSFPREESTLPQICGSPPARRNADSSGFLPCRRNASAAPAKAKSCASLRPSAKGSRSLGNSPSAGGTMMAAPASSRAARRRDAPLLQSAVSTAVRSACQYPVHSCQCVRVSVHCFSLSPPLRQQLCPLRKDRLLPLFQKSHSCRFHALFPLFR